MRQKKMMCKCLAGVMTLFMCVGSSGVNAFAEAGDTQELGTVETAYGSAQGVSGDTYDNVTLFKGVPYAAPPVDGLRWKEPQDPEAWDGVRIFDKYADAPCQWENDMAADPWKTDFYYNELPEFSEDCLYLNIATPSVAGDEEMPVYVWFHGGGLNHGYSYEVECDPEALAAKGVVVVEVGTRLGVFGYMSLPQLDAESEYGASGNYGLMDSIKAVEWVKENIKGFGGNPENITLGGQSGGTSKTAAFFASDIGAGLADNVIWQTGLKYDTAYKTQEEIQEISIAWLKECGLTGEESLEELQAMDAAVFMGKEDNYKNAPQGMTVDGKYIQYNNLKEAYEAGLFGDVNILVGANLGESTQDGINGNPMESAEEFYSYYKELLGDLYEEYDFENLVPVTDENALETARNLNSQGFSTSMTTNITAVELFGQHYDTISENGNVFVYLFAHKTPGRNEDYYWAWHSSELWYTFGSLRDIPEQREWTEWDHELADICTSYWTNFMKTGNPNSEGLAEWLPSDSAQLAYMNLGEKDTLGCVTDKDKLKELMIAFCEKQFQF
ncbi:MAG: carboxylesterase family protein [Eubacteriales bacterium]|nr:carboxylesterase family protein [Eubacteriales bacterium]